ncbi:MAG: hypothetical protein J6I85_09645 [Clostridia bacterium]|nr:hypothetical protein [Clostridia bacterium]
MSVDILKLMKEDKIIIADYDIFRSIENDYVLDEFYQHARRLEEGLSKEYKIDFIQKNKDVINFDKLITLAIKNKSDSIDAFRGKLQNHIDYLNSLSPNANYEKLKYEIEIKNMQDIIKSEKDLLAKIRKAARGIEVYIVAESYDYENKIPKLKIIDSRKIIEGKNPNKDRKLAKFEKFFSRLEKFKGVNADGLKGFFYVLPINEAISIFPNDEFNEEVFKHCLDMCLWKCGIKEEKDIEKAKDDSEGFYDKYIDGKDGEFILSVVYPILKEHIEYIDIDKLVMLGAYRINEKLEKAGILDENLELYKNILIEIEKYCKENKISDSYKLRILGDSIGWDSERIVQYSSKNIKACLGRFIEGNYISDRKLEGLKKAVDDGMIYLDQLPAEYLKLMYKAEDYKRIIFVNERNLKHTIEVADLNKDDILEALTEIKPDAKAIEMTLDNNYIMPKEAVFLYMDGHIDKEILLEALKGKNKKCSIDYSILIGKYQYGKTDSQVYDSYDKYLSISKEIIEQTIDERCLKNGDLSREEVVKEVKQEFSEDMMETFAENYKPEKREEYIDQLENFYREGILNIESIINWEDESIVARFLRDRIIDSTTIKRLMDSGEITTRYAQSLFGEYILDKEIPDTKRVELIKSGLISEDYIGKAYKVGLIKSVLADELTEKGLFEKNKYEEISPEELKQDKYILGDLNFLTKARSQFSNKPYKPRSNVTDTGILIDPDAREDLFELLKAKKAMAPNIQEDSSFYNYEFYLLPDENKKYGLDSVVIAERYYTNKDTKKTFATQNATYFFKWRDLVYMSGLRKSEIAKASKDIVYRANHVVSDGEDKQGRWGESVLVSIGKTMLGRESRKYSKKELKEKALEKVRKIYTPGEWEKIENQTIDIDVGEYSFKRNNNYNLTDNIDLHDDGQR